MSETQVKHDRSQLIQMAEVAMNCERYKDAVRFISDAVKSCNKHEFTVQERVLFANGFKNLIGSSRVAWKSVVASIKADAETSKHLEHYKSQLAQEIVRLCRFAISLLDDSVLPNALDPSNTIFFWKLKADCYRYIAEVVTPQEQEVAVRQSMEAYAKAVDFAMKFLPPPDIIRLEVFLSFSVFFFEILNEPALACEISQFTLDEVSRYEHKISKDSNHSALVIMNLMQNNIRVWTAVASIEQPKRTETQSKLIEEAQKLNMFPLMRKSAEFKKESPHLEGVSRSLAAPYSEVGISIKPELEDLTIVTSSLSTVAIRTVNSGDENKPPFNRSLPHKRT
jgi:hypothetical protein